MAFHQLALQKPPELRRRHRIQAAGRLIQQKHAGPMDHRPRQPQAMHLAGGKRPHLAIDECGHPHEFGQFFNTPGRFGIEEIVHGGEELEILASGKPLVEAAVGGGVKPKLGAYLRTFPFHVVTGNPGAAPRRHQQGGQNA